MVKISERDLSAVLEIAERVANRTGCKVVVRWDRISIIQQETQT